MNATLALFADLVSALDPGIEPNRLIVNVTSCDDDPSRAGHLHLCNPSYRLNPTETMREVTIGELPGLDVRRSGHDGDDITLTNLLHALVDVELADMLAGLRHLKEAQPLENDADKIISRVADPDALSDLAYEYIGYEESIHEMLSEILVPGDDTRYADSLRVEAQRLCDDLIEIRDRTVGSERARALMADAAANLGIDRDETLVRVQVNEAAAFRRDDEHTHPQRNWGVALWFACCGGESGLYSPAMVTMPVWAIRLYQIIAPDVVNSSLYPLETTPSDVLETAESLWRDGGEFADFDQAYRSAQRLHDC